MSSASDALSKSRGLHDEQRDDDLDLPPGDSTELGFVDADHEVALTQAADDLRDIKSVTDAALSYLDVDELLGALLDRVLELLSCDTAAVLILDPSSQQLVARAARGLEEEVRQGVRIPVGVGFAGHIASERRPVVLDEVNETTVANPILWEKGISSMLGVPLVAAGTLIGVLHVGSFGERKFDAKDAMLLELVADRIAAAVQVSQAESERIAAGVLQRSLLPSALPPHPRIEFASRYSPAQRGGIGGDWYDAFELPTGQVWVMTGDVVGHGLRSAIVMGRLRSALRAYALLGMTPEDVLQGANRKLQLFEPGAIATVVCIAISPPFDEIRVATAGHPPPVLACPGDEPRLLYTPPAPPLGVVDDLAAHSTKWSIVERSVLVLYTDGLIERRGESLTEGLERLRSHVRIDEPDRLCRQLMDVLIADYVPDDDVALLAVRIDPDSQRPAEIPFDSGDASIVRSALFPCDPKSVAAARRFISQCVEQLGLQTMPEVTLLTSELAANAVLHAHSPFDVTVEKLQTGGARVEVRDFGGGRPELLDRPIASVGGRGLQIVDLVATTWGVDERQGGSGKCTWFTVEI